MFEGLREAIEGAVVPVDGDAIAEARSLLDALAARIAEAESVYASSGRFEVDGFGTMAAFLRSRCRLSNPDARRTATRAARLSGWPEMAEAWRSGSLAGAQIDAAVALVPDRHVERFASVAAETVGILGSLSVLDTRAVVGHWVTCADAAAEREAAEAGVEDVPPAPERELSASRILDDVLVVNATFDPDSAAYVEKALTAAMRPDSDDERRTPAERRADALVEVCRRYLEGLDNPDGNRRQERLTIVADVRVLYRAALRGAGVVTADHLDRFLDARPDLGAVERGLFCDAFEGAGGTASTLDGNPISDGLVSCLSSGGTLERLLTVEGRVLDHGRTIRTFTPAQRRAVLARDRGCRVAGCDVGPERCDIHHVQPWESGGRTDITNAVTKCRHEHLDHHRRRWPDRLEPDGTYTVTTDTGVEHTTRPPGWAPPPQIPTSTTAAGVPTLPFDAHYDHHHPTFLAEEQAAIRQRITELAELTRGA